MHIKRPPLIMRIMANTKNAQKSSPRRGKTRQKRHIGPVYGPYMAHRSYALQ
jgi:hypothetical protein